MYYKNKTMSLFYEQYGTGKNTILILPGWGDTRNTFHFLIENLKSDFSIYIFDYPGFGRSSFPCQDITIYDYGQYFQDFIANKKIQEPILIGHSFGGRIAILLSSIFKVKIKKMVLIDAAGIKPRKTFKQYLRQTIYKTLKKLRYLLPSNSKQKYQKWLLKKFSSADYQALSPEMMTTFRNVVNEDLTKYLADIKIDTLLIWGECDVDTPISDGILMNEKINNSALIPIHHSSHYCYLEQPFLILHILRQFLH